MPEFFLTLVSKITLTEQVYLLTFVTDRAVSYRPGQFVSLETWPQVFRAYSIAYLGAEKPFFLEGENLPATQPQQNHYLSLLVSTKPGGLASGYFEAVTVGAGLRALNISGRFGLKDTICNKCFVCTGTGLAPFVPMINRVASQFPNMGIDLFFGACQRSQDFSSRFFDSKLLRRSNFRIYSCIDAETFPESEYLRVGRVTEIIPEKIHDWAATEFYLCGNPFMVKAMEQLLQARGVPPENVCKEAFGSIQQILRQGKS